VLNKSVPEARGEIVFFSDCSSMLKPNAVRLMMENFADPQVGGVCGSYRVVNPDQADIGQQEDFYWRYETALKNLESSADSILGAHGQIHALRRELYSPPHPRTVNDDFVIPMRVVAQGYREVYDPRAQAVEEAREMTGFRRRIRITAGNIQQLGEIWHLLRGRRWVPLFCMLSHKLTRLLVPFAMMAAVVLNAFLLDAGLLYQATAAGQGVFYALVAAGGLWPLRPKILRLPYYFCMVNASIFAGMYHAIQGRRNMAWK
ncbi:MAG: glycosyltransferase family 2 protein, partial [Candidatus Solibacter usitatus]|nr:glycosyltransferase family 2 protein [Candidatus Solibacter usitatus]